MMNIALGTRFKFLSMNRMLKATGVSIAMLLGLMVAFPSQAVDFANLGTIGGPLADALTQLSNMNTGVKALIGFIGFVVALISLASLRNMGPVLFFIGLAIFAGVGLTVAGTIMGADVGHLPQIAGI